MPTLYNGQTREEVMITREEYYARLNRLHFEAGFVVHVIGLLDKQLAGHQELATIFGGKCPCGICNSEWN